jgi:hypothetical protein
VTKSGGEHHWFRQPAVPIRFVKWAGGEVLGNGRFVVGYAVPEGPIPELPEVFCHLTINKRSWRREIGQSCANGTGCFADVHSSN